VSTSRSWFEDREGHLWLGANGRGLHRVRPQPIVSGSQPQGLIVRGAHALLQFAIAHKAEISRPGMAARRAAGIGKKATATVRAHDPCNIRFA
jgi:hypothetical protein